MALKRVEEYLSEKGTYEEIARTNGFSSWTLKQWVNKYREQGAAAFAIYKGNAHYSKEFKIRSVEAVISTEAPDWFPIAENKRIQRYKAKFTA